MIEESITSFSGEYACFSNFYLEPVEFEKEIYPSNEHAYHAAKTLHLETRKRFRLNNLTPGQAKREGRRIDIRPDWPRIKFGTMFELVKKKFSYNEELYRILMDTGTKNLIEGNTWGDKIWGAVLENGVWVGRNWLGNILMSTRDQPAWIRENQQR
jgi:hypothetical protein